MLIYVFIIIYLIYCINFVAVPPKTLQFSQEKNEDGSIEVSCTANDVYPTPVMNIRVGNKLVHFYFSCYFCFKNILGCCIHFKRYSKRNIKMDNVF